jgi:broad specificity phosphatase PhoE
MAAGSDDGFPYGERTTVLVDGLAAEGVTRMSLLMRHSAREYAPGRHDLENPLTERGRALARSFGARLPADWVIRAYASPAPRCLDTAELIHAAHLEVGGRGSGGSRPVEGLGVFYVLDQMRMFKALSVAAEGMHGFVAAWLAGRVSADIVLPPATAAAALVDLLVARLRDQPHEPALDLCVSHDLTLYLLRGQLLGRTPSAQDPVRYLDGVVFFERGGDVWAAAHDVPPFPLSSTT